MNWILINWHIMLRVQVGNLTTYHREEILIRPPGFGLHPMWPSYWITTKSSIEGGLADQMANSQPLELTPVSTFLLVSLNDFLTRLWECLLHCLFCVCLGSKVEQLGWLWRGSQSDFCLTSFCVIFSEHLCLSYIIISIQLLGWPS